MSLDVFVAAYKTALQISKQAALEGSLLAFWISWIVGFVVQLYFCTTQMSHDYERTQQELLK